MEDVETSEVPPSDSDAFKAVLVLKKWAQARQCLADDKLICEIEEVVNKAVIARPPTSVAKRKEKNYIFPSGKISGKLFFLFSWKNLRFLKSNTYVYVYLVVVVHIAGVVDFGPKIIVEPSTCQNFYLHHVSNGL